MGTMINRNLITAVDLVQFRFDRPIVNWKEIGKANLEL